MTDRDDNGRTKDETGAALQTASGDSVADYRLTRDLRASAKLMGRDEARYLVDFYYNVQNYRIRASNQERALTESGEPHALIAWSFGIFERFEKDVQGALHVYARNSPLGRWALTIHGIGPVIAAGLMAHIDIEKAETAGAIWRFAGLDPNLKWLGKAGAQDAVDEALGSERFTAASAEKVARHVDRDLGKLAKMGLEDGEEWTRKRLIAALARRPWNADLKRLCWIIGGSFVRLRHLEGDIYGKVYEERKALEVYRNERGKFAELAARTLETKKFKDKEVRAVYEAGRLPDGRIDLRARRYAVKLFLSHYHHVAYEIHHKRLPPKPYVLEHGGHTHFTGPPNWPME